jgi:FkbM family methyltransferase
MKSLRSHVVRMFKRQLESRGRMVVPRGWGLDPLADVRRLAQIWHYPLELLFDIGANEGQTAKRFLQEFPGAEVLSFEPHPATFARLTERMSEAPHFRAFNLGLSTEIGEMEMFEYELSTINSLTPDAQYATRYQQQGRSVSVKVSTVDAFCAQQRIGLIDLLKIDTEGFDLIVLKGGAGMLEKRAVRFVLVEFNDLQPTEGVFGGALLPFDEFLRPLGFQFVATYNDYINTQAKMFAVSNALFCLPPGIPTESA